MTTTTPAPSSTPLSPAQRDALGAIALLAAFADGEPSDAERSRLSTFTGPDKPLTDEVYQRVIFRRTSAAQEAAVLDTPDLRRAAFELAVGVCDADHSTSPAERAFLDDLAKALSIPSADAAALIDSADALADLPASSPLPPALAPIAAAAPASSREAEVDSVVRTHAILCAALELLPQGLASAAIIPVQTRMVYSIGKAHGYELSAGHIKDFIATIGVGITSQVVESYARRLVSSMSQKLAGKLVGASWAKSLGSWSGTASGAAITFGTTYALGYVAGQYYAGGRKLSAIDLQALFREQSEKAKSLYDQNVPLIQEQAAKLNPAKLLGLAGLKS